MLSATKAKSEMKFHVIVNIEKEIVTMYLFENTLWHIFLMLYEDTIWKKNIIKRVFLL